MINFVDGVDFYIYDFIPGVQLKQQLSKGQQKELEIATGIPCIEIRFIDADRERTIERWEAW